MDVKRSPPTSEVNCLIRWKRVLVFSIKNTFNYKICVEIFTSVNQFSSLTGQNFGLLRDRLNRISLYCVFMYNVLFQFTGIQEACCQYLIRNLDILSCLSIWEFADKYSLRELSQSCLAFAAQNVVDISESSEFYNLSATNMSEVSSFIR